jgi:hypothetical protein
MPSPSGRPSLSLHSWAGRPPTKAERKQIADASPALNPAWAQATVHVGLVDGLSSLRLALSSPTPTGTDQREPLSPHRTGSLK